MLPAPSFVESMINLSVDMAPRAAKIIVTGLHTPHWWFAVDLVLHLLTLVNVRYK